MGNEREIIRERFRGCWQEFYRPFVEGLKQTTRDEYQALCPFHEDMNPSLSINATTGVHYCHGCKAGGDHVGFYARIKKLNPETDFPRIMRGIVADFNLDGKAQSRIVATYDYTDEAGTVLFQVCRFNPKGFRQRRPDGNGGWIWNLGDSRRVLYRLPEVVTAETVLVVEGEKDADALAELGFAATTNPGGAGKWRPEYSEALKGKTAILIPDNDEPGRKHVQDVAQQLQGKARAVYVAEIKDQGEKADVSDFLARVPGAYGELLQAIEAVQAAPLPADGGPADGIYKNSFLCIYIAECVKTQPKNDAEITKNAKDESTLGANAPVSAGHKRTHDDTKKDTRSENQIILGAFQDVSAGKTLTIRDVETVTGLHGQRVRRGLQYWKAAGKLEADPLVVGGYREIVANLGYKNYKVENRHPAALGFWLPAGLDRYVTLPPGSVVIIGGETGSGKTTLSLNFCRRMDADHEIVYINTEYGDEWLAKLDAFADEPDERLFRQRGAWNFKLVDAGGVAMKDLPRYVERDKGNIFDWIPAGMGSTEEYKEVPQIVRAIKDSLGVGFAIVILQKRPDWESRGKKEHGMVYGGPNTIAMASLYLEMAVHRDSRIRTLRVGKARNLRDSGKNPEGLTLEYRIVRGTKLFFPVPFIIEDRGGNSTAV